MGRNLLFASLFICATAAAESNAPPSTPANETAPIPLAKPVAEPEPPPGTQEHTVRPGDTLWDLTQRYLQNPWYWPKVWSYNPQLTNPHWIYPGEKVRFYPNGAGEQQPARIETASLRQMPPQESDYEGKIKTLSDDHPVAEAVSVAGNRPLVYNTNRGMVAQTVQLVTPRELQEAGEVQRGFDNKTMMSTYDIIYVHFSGQRPAVKAPVIIYKKVLDVTHPTEGRDYGYLTQITATGEVTTMANEKLVGVRITQTWEPVERGQLVAPQQGPLRFELAEQPNKSKISGVLLMGEYRSRQIYGQFHYVFVDRGTKDGVQNGNTFQVFSDRDYFESTDGEPVPERVVGKLVVVDAKETASLAMVVQSLRELEAGQRVEMR